MKLDIDLMLVNLALVRGAIEMEFELKLEPLMEAG